MASGFQLLGDHVKTVIFSCSEYEAKNYGMYLQIHLLLYSRFIKCNIGRQGAFC